MTTLRCSIPYCSIVEDDLDLDFFPSMATLVNIEIQHGMNQITGCIEVRLLMHTRLHTHSWVWEDGTVYIL